MRTNIDIDEELMAKAMAALGTNTKRATVVKALNDAVALHEQLKRQSSALKALWGIAPDWNDGRFDEGENPEEW